LNKGNWDIIHAKGINGENKSFDFLLFMNSKSALMLGSGYSDDDIINKKFNNINAVLYYSKNGGLDWVENILGKGQFTSYTVKDSLVFIAKTINTANSKDASFSDSAKIYFSKDFGVSWSEISSFNKFFVRDMFSLSEKEMYLIGKRNNESFWTLNKTMDRGLTWNEVGKITNEINSPVEFNRYLFYLSQKDQKHLMKISLSTGKAEYIDLGNNEFAPYFLTVINNELYVTGLLKNRVTIYKLDPAHPELQYVSNIAENDKFPIYLHSIKNKLILFIGERNSIGVSYFIYSAQDEQNGWNVNPVPSSYFKPFVFFENEAWGYSYDAKFYKSELLSDLK
jgi:hypothetical protein